MTKFKGHGQTFNLCKIRNIFNYKIKFILILNSFQYMDLAYFKKEENRKELAIQEVQFCLFGKLIHF